MDNNTKQQLISLIPEMTIMKKSGFSYPQILQHLKFKYDINLLNEKSSILTQFINPKYNINLNSRFKEFVILHESAPASNIIHVMDYGLRFTRRDFVFSQIHLVDSVNIFNLPNLMARLIAKRIMRMHNIPDTILINDFQKSFPEETASIYNLPVNPNNINENILDIFEDLKNQLQQILFQHYTLEMDQKRDFKNS